MVQPLTTGVNNLTVSAALVGSVTVLDAQGATAMSYAPAQRVAATYSEGTGDGQANLADDVAGMLAANGYLQINLRNLTGSLGYPIQWQRLKYLWLCNNSAGPGNNLYTNANTKSLGLQGGDLVRVPPGGSCLFVHDPFQGAAIVTGDTLSLYTCPSVPAPTVAPTLTSAATGGSLGITAIDVAYTATDGFNGNVGSQETSPSPVATIAPAPGGTATVTVSGLVPGASGQCAIYAGYHGEALSFVGYSAGSSYTFGSLPPANEMNPPTTNAAQVSVVSYTIFLGGLGVKLP